MGKETAQVAQVAASHQEGREERRVEAMDELDFTLNLGR